MVVEGSPTKSKENSEDDLDPEIFFSQKYAARIFPRYNDNMVIKVHRDGVHFGAKVSFMNIVSVETGGFKDNLSVFKILSR